MDEERLMSLDPSSTRTGYCIMDRSSERILEAGILSGKRRALPEIRIAAMANDLMILLDRWQPGTVILETTSGRVNRHRHKGTGQGLATLGLAIGRLWGQVECWKHALRFEDRDRARVVLIRENRWIAGRTKQERQRAVALAYAEYDPTKDAGADVSDSITMAWWWIREQKLRVVRLAEDLE